MSTFELPFPVPDYKYKEENGGGIKLRTGGKLYPDRFSRLVYPCGDRRVLLIEADCHTEPGRSDNLKRKSLKHNLLSYYALFNDGAIRKQYFGSDLAGVLNVFSSPVAMRLAMDVHAEVLGDRARFMLYQTWEAFGDFFSPPTPRPELFTEPWHRVGHPAVFISEP